MATQDARPPQAQGPLARVDAGWRWFRSRPLGVQIGAWAVVAVLVAVIGLAIEQQPPNSSPLANQPDNGVVSGAGGSAGGAATGNAASVGTAGGAAGAAGGGQGNTVTNAAGGIEGQDVQQAAGAQHVEVGAVHVGPHFRATAQSLRTVFDEALNNRGRAGLNANQFISAQCSKGNCVLKYVPDGPGAGRIMEAEGPIWETLLKDPTWKAATIEALPGGPDLAGRGPHGGPNAAHGGPPSVVISCTRAQVIAVGVWGTQSGPRVTQICQVGHAELKGA